MKVIGFPIFLFLTILTGCSRYEPLELEVFMADEATHVFLWENNRKVSWMTCGDPQGFPIFFAHGCPGSRLEIIFLDSQARKYGLKIIVFERPGFGRSDYIDGYTLLSFADDLERIADTLKIGQFGLIGWSSGGPPVLAAACHMPERALFVFSVSGYTDFGKFEDAKKLMAEYKLYGPQLSENRPRLFHRILDVVSWTDRNLPNFYFKLAKGEMSEPDRGILNNVHVADLFIRDQEETIIVGTKGILQDLTTQWSPWDFDMTQIQVPAYIFQGKKDNFVPWQFAEHLAKNIPDATLRIYENRGHLFILDASFQEELFILAKKIVGNHFK